MTGYRQQRLFDTDDVPWEREDQGEQCIATVIFPGAVEGPYDYLVTDPRHAQLTAGCRVRVPLGRGNHLRVGYCVGVCMGRPERRLKAIRSIVDPSPLLTPGMIRLTRWMAEYYLVPWGVVLEAVVPAGVRESAGVRTQTVFQIADTVARQLGQLKLPAKQARVIQCLARSGRPLTAAELSGAAGCSAGPIQALHRKGLIQASVSRIERVGPRELAAEPAKSIVLNRDQQVAIDAILAAIDSGRHETLLVYGVTGSGKTEVYIRAIEQVVRRGQQAIVLVPEISLTPQTQARFKARFPNVAVLHSHLSDAERHAYWRRIADGQAHVVVGARSAVFAPAPRPGLIVVDEEQDSSFKQDTVPRYHARDVALERARQEHIPLVLGSATPSLESWAQAKRGIFRLLTMPRRVLERALPSVTIIDLREAGHYRFSRGGISRPLAQAMRSALSDGGQVILLLNRRGFSTHIQCPACGKVVRCPDCDIALTHHREGERAVCHYCDYHIPAPRVCPQCRFEGIRFGGLGTQRLESEVRARFPEFPCLRVDADSMRRAGSHEDAFSKFRRGEVRILLGTQMIAKGLDFPNVTLVGVINADIALHLPDFRAAERTFQLVAQVAGRTGRGEKGGHVLVQTSCPDHPAIANAQRHDYATFANGELAARQQFGYPPYRAMIRILVRSEDDNAACALAKQLAQAMGEYLASAPSPDPPRLVGPAPAPMPKLRGKYRYHVILLGSDREVLRAAVVHARNEVAARETAQWIVDVDPVDMM